MRSWGRSPSSPDAEASSPKSLFFPPPPDHVNWTDIDIVFVFVFVFVSVSVTVTVIVFVIGIQKLTVASICIQVYFRGLLPRQTYPPEGYYTKPPTLPWAAPLLPFPFASVHNLRSGFAR